MYNVVRPWNVLIVYLFGIVGIKIIDDILLSLGGWGGWLEARASEQWWSPVSPPPVPCSLTKVFGPDVGTLKRN